MYTKKSFQNFERYLHRMFTKILIFQKSCSLVTMNYGIITPEEFTDTLTLTVDAKTKANAAINYFEPTGELFDNNYDNYK